MPEEQKILFICDDETQNRYMKEKLATEAGYEVSIAADSLSAVAAMKQDVFGLIIVKFDKLDAAAEEIVKDLKKIDPDCVIIGLINKTEPEAGRDFLRIGVYDFISKPINLEKLFFLVKKGIELHALMLANQKLKQGLKERNVSLEKQNILLAKRIEDSTKNLTRLYEDLRSTYMRTIRALAHAIEARDHYTHSHSENVARCAILIAEEMNLSAKDIEHIRQACELHDLGKIGIEDTILSKPGALTKEEWEQIKRHPVTGAQILEPLTFLNDVIELVRQHHEHYDGSGYPEGRRGEDILLGSRIIHLADAYDAMRSERPYRKVPFTKDEAVTEIEKHSGTQFDPQVVEAFLRIVDKI